MENHTSTFQCGDDMPSGGDCFTVAARLVAMRDPHPLKRELDSIDDLTLVHGVVTGQRAIEGVQYSHAWIEGNHNGVPVVADFANGNRFIGPAAFYYAIGRIDDTALCRYTPEQARCQLVDHAHFGPWEGAALAIGL